MYPTYKWLKDGFVFYALWHWDFIKKDPCCYFYSIVFGVAAIMICGFCCFYMVFTIYGASTGKNIITGGTWSPGG